MALQKLGLSSSVLQKIYEVKLRVLKNHYIFYVFPISVSLSQGIRLLFEIR
jgi:hypothetical protein